MHLRTKLDVFEVHGSHWVMVDLLKLFDEHTYGKSVPPDYYHHYISLLKDKYLKELKLAAPRTVVIQKDLEQEIQDANELDL